MALPKFEKRPVVRAAVKITNAGDGLSEAMRLAPEALSLGEEVWFVIKGEVSRIAHEPAPKDDHNLVRVHVVKASDVALVDKAAVQDILAAEQDRIARLREAEEGVQRLIDDPLNLDGRPEDDAPTQPEGMSDEEWEASGKGRVDEEQ